MSHNIETILAQANGYFIGKIITGDYKVKSFGLPYSVEVQIDGKYNFFLWVANELYGFRIATLHDNFMQLNFSEQEKEVAYGLISEKVEQHEAEVLRVQRLEEYRKLKAEFEDGDK